MRQRARASYQGLSAPDVILDTSGFSPDSCFVVTSIDVSPSTGGVSWKITEGSSSGTIWFLGALALTDPVTTFSLEGERLLYPGESLWGTQSGGSIDVQITGFWLPYPAPFEPLGPD